jgi:sugar/nucleoside kinase (ribokinase family)
MSVDVVGDLMTDVVAWASAPLAHASDTAAQVTAHPGGGGANVAAAFRGWTAGADWLLPNAAEAAVLTGARGAEAAAWALARDGTEVVVTLGPRGALWSDGEQVLRAPAAPAAAPVDSTGAETPSRPAGSRRGSAAPSRPTR